MTFEYASDRSLLVSLGDGIDLKTLADVRRLLRLLETEPPHAILNLHPAYNSVLIKFDPRLANHETISDWLRTHEGRLETIDLQPSALIDVPVLYGGQVGPDLAGVAALHSITPEQVVREHSGAEYMVYFLGFVPGFAYLGGLPETLVTPRLDSPRKRVEAGSVGIAGTQAGIYPMPTPGGWRLIGRTPLRVFQPGRERMSLLEIGDRVRFRPIGAAEFERLQAEQA